MVVVTEVPPILPYVVTHRVFLGLFSIPCHFGGGIFIPIFVHNFVDKWG